MTVVYKKRVALEVREVEVEATIDEKTLAGRLTLIRRGGPRANQIAFDEATDVALQIALCMLEATKAIGAAKDRIVHRPRATKRADGSYAVGPPPDGRSVDEHLDELTASTNVRSRRRRR